MGNKFELHKKFWNGEGPCLILIPPLKADLYDLDNYPARFRDPRLMWESEIRRAKGVIDWPTDGIPTVRPNLGVITIPAMAGQSFTTPPGSMPWPGKPLSRNRIKELANKDILNSEIFRLAADFYRIHVDSGETWREYTERIGSLTAQTGARVILRPVIFPDNADECREMQELWHQITS